MEADHPALAKESELPTQPYQGIGTRAFLDESTGTKNKVKTKRAADFSAAFLNVWISLFDEPHLFAARRQEMIRYDLPESVRRAASRSRERVMSNLKQSFEAELSERTLKVKHRTLQQKPVRALLRWPALPARHSRLSWLYL